MLTQLQRYHRRPRPLAVGCFLAAIALGPVSNAQAQTLLDRFVDEYVRETNPREPERPKEIDLVGRRAVGTLGEINGGTRFMLHFKAGGVVDMSTAEEGTVFKGSWSRSGNQISMKAGASTFQGTIAGTRISGTRSRSNAKNLNDTRDTWSVTLEP